MAKTNTAKPEKGKCINVECANKAHTRGLCASCYTVARRIIRNGEANEENLIAQGKILPRFSAERKISARTKWFSDPPPTSVSAPSTGDHPTSEE